MGISNILNNVADAASGNQSKSTLDDFLNKFNSADQKFVNTIDPLTTFDLYIKFYPIPDQSGGSNSSRSQRIKDALTRTVQTSITNFGNNITGGLLGSIINNKNVLQVHENWSSKNNEKTFVEMLLDANLIVGGDNWYANNSSDPLELNLGPYVQSIQIPNLIMEDSGSQATLLGQFPNNGSFVKPDNNELILNVINSKASLHERLFYPWMKEVTLPYWSYATQPYTTATITVDFTKHNDLKYVFCGCRPNQIFSLQANQQVGSADNLTRQVKFMFDFMFIHSDLNTIESVKSKLKSTAGTIFNSVAKSINF